MALVNVMNINVLDNPTVFINPFQFEITFEAKEALPDGENQNPIVHAHPAATHNVYVHTISKQIQETHYYLQISSGKQPTSVARLTANSTKCWRRCWWDPFRRACTSSCCR